jgi:hypothetical protein
MTTRPIDMAAQQAKMNKQNETQIAQNATVINRDAERDAARTIRTEKAEGQKIGTEERERGDGSAGEQEGKEAEQQGQEKQVDPMLLLPVEKGKFAKPKKHYINVEV